MFLPFVLTPQPQLTHILCASQGLVTYAFTYCFLCHMFMSNILVYMIRSVILPSVCIQGWSNLRRVQLQQHLFILSGRQNIFQHPSQRYLLMCNWSQLEHMDTLSSKEGEKSWHIAFLASEVNVGKQERDWK